MYDNKFLRTTILCMRATDLRDLWQWSIHNKDKYNAEIHAVEKALKKLTEAFEEDEEEDNAKLYDTFWPFHE